MIPALTITQPWASLVAIGAKRVETRGWSTKYRGPLAIHAGLGLRREVLGTARSGLPGLREICAEEPFAAVLARAGLAPSELPRGAIVALAELDRVTRMEYSAIERLSEQEAAFGFYAPGRYAWVLRNVRALADPIPVSGAQQLWMPPPGVQERLVALTQASPAIDQEGGPSAA